MHHRDRLCPPQAELHEHAATLSGPIVGVERIECHGCDDLVGFEHGLAEAGKELVDRDGALSPDRCHGDVGTQGHERRDRVVGRAGGDDVADHRGPVAQRRRTHLKAGLCQRQAGGAHRCRSNDIGMSDQRSERDATAARGDPVEARQSGDVDQQLDTGASPSTELKHQIGAARDQPRRATVRREQLSRLVERSGGYVAARQRGRPLRFMKLEHSAYKGVRCAARRRPRCPETVPSAPTGLIRRRGFLRRGRAQ